MVRSLVVVPALVLTLLSLAACELGDPAKFPRTIEVRIPTNAPAPLDVETANGAIAIAVAGASEVVVTAAFHCTSEARAKSVALHAMPNQGGTLEVHPIWPEGRRQPNESCAFTVAAPAFTTARLRTSNGSVTVDGATTKLEAVTSNGGITVRGALPDGSLKTSNGDVGADGALGNLTLLTSNGSITLTFAAGSAGTRTVTTSNGSVTLNGLAHAGGVIAGSTSNGSIRIPDPGDDRARMERSSRSFTLTFDAASPRTTVTTDNGSIEGSY